MPTDERNTASTGEYGPSSSVGVLVSAICSDKEFRIEQKRRVLSGHIKSLQKKVFFIDFLQNCLKYGEPEFRIAAQFLKERGHFAKNTNIGDIAIRLERVWRKRRKILQEFNQRNSNQLH